MTAVEDDFGQTEEVLKPQPWRWGRLAGISISALGNVANAVALACQETAEAIASHLTYREDRRDFVESVTSDLAQLPTVEHK